MLISIMVFSGTMVYHHLYSVLKLSAVQAYSAVFRTSQRHVTKSIQYITAEPMVGHVTH